MPLTDLYKHVKRGRDKKTSFINAIDRFLYAEELAILRGKKKGSDIVKEEAQILFDITKDHHLTAMKLKSNYRDVYFHPSSLGACARKTFFNYFKAPKDAVTDFSIQDTAKGIRIFKNGDFFHLRMQVLFVRMGLAKLEDIEVPFTVGDEQGTTDCIAVLDDIRFIVDFKSINNRRFLDVSKKGHDQVYDNQIRRYMYHFKIKDAVFIYENKDNQKLEEVFVVESKAVNRKAEQRLQYLRDSVAKGKMPDREGKFRDRVPCSYCPFKGVCWEPELRVSWLRKLRKDRNAKKLSKEKKSRSKAKSLDL